MLSAPCSPTRGSRLLVSSRGRPAGAPWRLSLATVLQFSENLSDRRAAEAARGRIDWEYLLGLDRTDPDFDASVLCDSRPRLVAAHAETLLLDTLPALCRDRQLLAARGRQCTDSMNVLGAVRGLNRLDCVAETLRATRDAVADPGWWRTGTEETWSVRYVKPADDLYVPVGEGRLVVLMPDRSAATGTHFWRPCSRPTP